VEEILRTAARELEELAHLSQIGFLSTFETIMKSAEIASRLLATCNEQAENSV
jgi:hypothetical protein